VTPKHGRLPPGRTIDESQQRQYEGIVTERLPGVDAAAWMLFTFVLGAGRRAETFLGEVVRRYGLDGAQLSVLLVLWMNGPPHRLSPTHLSRNIAQSPSGMTHTVKRLTTAGLVTRVGLPTDGRAKHVELTPDGVELVTLAARDLAAAIEELFPRSALPVDELTAQQRQIVNVMTTQGRLDGSSPTGQDARP
jgi:DNA-binding MarR family transcriptional regulator